MRKHFIILGSVVIVVVLVFVLFIVLSRKERDDAIDDYTHYEEYDIKEDSPVVPLEEMELDLERFQKIRENVERDEESEE